MSREIKARSQKIFERLRILPVLPVLAVALVALLGAVGFAAIREGAVESARPAAGGSSARGRSQDTSKDRPNFIIILTDDLDVPSVEFLPRVKALLAKEGTTFSNYFVTDSVCCPSRASLLRGQYPHNHQVLSNHPPEGSFEKFNKLGEERSTIATWLQAAGYRTVLLGKYLNNYIGKDSRESPDAHGLREAYAAVKDYLEKKPLYVPPGWDEWYALINHHTRYFDYQFNENGRAVSYGDKPDDYETDVLAEKTVDFISRTAGKQPFFIYLAPSAPHGPARPAPRHKDDFPQARAPRTASFDEKDVSGKPAWVRATPPLLPEQIAHIDSLYRRRLQSMLAVDEMVEKIVGALAARGLLDQTYIFFTSDNGFHLGQHRLDQGKSTAYEEDIRVPLVVRGPGVPAGKTIQPMALNIDLAPTLSELAGITAPDFIDGRSLKPLLAGAFPAHVRWRDDFAVEFWPHPTPHGTGQPAYEALRTRDYLYVDLATGEKELYDLNADPDELHNLAAAAPGALTAKLAKRLAELRHCAAASCRMEPGGLL